MSATAVPATVAAAAAIKTVKVKLNGEFAFLNPGRLITSLRAEGLRIPSVCFHPDIPHAGGRCRACCCTVNGRITSTCDVDVREGMEIVTNTPQLERMRDAALELVPHDDDTVQLIEDIIEEIEDGTLKEGVVPPEIEEHVKESMVKRAIRDANVAAAAAREAGHGHGGGGEHHEAGEQVHEGKSAATAVAAATAAGTSPCAKMVEKLLKLHPQDTIPLQKKSKYIVRDASKCVHCGLCTLTCAHVQGISAIADVRTHNGMIVEAFNNANLADSACASCGQCVVSCPTGALAEATETDVVEAVMNDPTKIKVIQFAPAVRVALAEEFGLPAGKRRLTGEMVAAARILCGRKNVFVFDTNFTADLTIIEEGHELLERLRRVLTGQKKLGNDHMSTKLPMITSCSPGWVLFAEKNYHDLLGNLSSCKSPQQMAGAIAKHYWAKREGLKLDDVVSISVMPCVAKKAEKERGFSNEAGLGSGHYDVDHVITTREFAQMCRTRGVDPTELKEEEFDSPFGIGTGAGAIFGATGGVMEAALRTVYEVVTGRPVPYRRLDIVDVRGMAGVKEATIPLRNVLLEYAWLEGVDVKVAVVHGLGNARRVMDRVRAAQEQGLPPPWHFIEAMACGPGGCLGGGGQPRPTTMATKMQRAKLIYELDGELPMRRSHENPAIVQLYREFLKEPLGHESHRLLHTSYVARTPEESSILASADAKRVREEVLYKGDYTPNSRTGITNMFSDIVDAYGWVSDAAIAAVAGFVGATPVAVDSICSHYHFFPRKPHHPSTTPVVVPFTSQKLRAAVSSTASSAADTTVATSTNNAAPAAAAEPEGKSKPVAPEGQAQPQTAAAPAHTSHIFICDCLMCRSRGSTEVKNAMRKTMEGSDIEVTTVQWLGFCMNGSPAAFVKHTNDPRLHAIYNLKAEGDARYASPDAVRAIDNPVGSKIDFRVLSIQETTRQLRGMHAVEEAEVAAAAAAAATAARMAYNGTTTSKSAENAAPAAAAAAAAAPSASTAAALHASSLLPSIVSNIALLPEDAQYFKEHHRCPVSRKIHAMSRDDIIAQLQLSGLRGCGGAGFPTYIKWRSVADVKVNMAGGDTSVSNDAVSTECATAPGKYVVINADEGLPSTFKDFVILASPHARMRMVIGAVTAARVVGAKTIFMYLRYEYKSLRRDIEQAFETYLTALAPPEVCASGLRFKIITGGGPYVCGEETALFESVEGNAPQSRAHRDRYATQAGLFGHPTLVNNVETLAWVPSVLYHGGQAFADLANRDYNEAEKGAKMLCVCGNVETPCVGEFPSSTSLRDVLRIAAPDVPEDDIAALEVGGVVERLIMGSKSVKAALDAPLSLEMSPRKQTERGKKVGKVLPGGGSIVVYRRSFKFNAAIAMQAKAKFAAKESCQLCAPCRNGTKAFRTHVQRMITTPRSLRSDEVIRMRKSYELMEQCSVCGHGKAVGKMARELLEDCVPANVIS